MKKNYSYRTRPYKTTIYVVIALIVFLLIWLLIGDMNLLNVEYLIPENGIFWTGKVTDANIPSLIAHYGAYYEPGVLETILQNFKDKTVEIHNMTGHCIFNINTVYWWLGGIGFCCLLPLIGKFCKFNNWDTYPFVLAMVMGGLIFNISGLIYYWSNSALWYLLRIFIFIVSLVIFFIMFNWIFGIIFKKSNYQGQYINELMSSKKLEDKINKYGNDVVNAYLKDKKDKEITYVETDREDKK